MIFLFVRQAIMLPLLRISHGQDQIEAVFFRGVLDDEGRNGPVEGSGDAFLSEGAQRIRKKFRIHRDGEVFPLRLCKQRFGNIAVLGIGIDAHASPAYFKGDEVVLVPSDEDGGALHARKQRRLVDGELCRKGSGDDALLFDEIALIEAGDDGHIA